MMRLFAWGECQERVKLVRLPLALTDVDSMTALHLAGVLDDTLPGFISDKGALIR